MFIHVLHPPLSATGMRGGGEAFNLATKFDKQQLVFMAKLRKKLVKEWAGGGGAGESKDGAKMRKRRRR